MKGLDQANMDLDQKLIDAARKLELLEKREFIKAESNL